MAPPHHANAGRAKPIDHAGRLGVVEEHDVAGVDQPEHLREVGTEHPFVGGALARAERTTVACRTVQQVVQSLREREELGLAVQDGYLAQWNPIR